MVSIESQYSLLWLTSLLFNGYIIDPMLPFCQRFLSWRSLLMDGSSVSVLSKNTLFKIEFLKSFFSKLILILIFVISLNWIKKNFIFLLIFKFFNYCNYFQLRFDIRDKVFIYFYHNFGQIFKKFWKILELFLQS
jgi:hypothetical protein